MKRLTLKNLLLVFISLTMAAFYSSCAKDYDDQFKQLEQTVAGNKQIIEEALAEQIKLMDDQLALLEKELQDYTDQAKADILNQLTERLEQLKNFLEMKIEALAASLDGKISALDGRITSLKDLIDAQLLVIGNRIEQIDEKLNILTSRVSDLENRASALEEYRKYVEGALEELYGNIEALENALSALRAEYEAADEQRRAEIEANTRLIEENKKAIGELAAGLEALEQKLQTAVTELENKIEAASLQAAEDLERAIEALEQELRDWSQEQMDLLGEWTQEQLQLMREWAGEQLDELKTLVGENRDNIAVNTQEIANLRSELADAIAEYTLEIAAAKDRLDSLEERMEALEDQVGNIEGRVVTLEGLYQDLIDSLNDSQNGILADIIGDISNIAGDLLDALNRIQAIEEGLADYYSKSEIENLIADLLNQLNNTRTDLMEYITDMLSRLNSMLTEEEIEYRLQLIADEFNDKLMALETRIADLETLLARLRVDVDNLLGRIQSITYVPDNFLGLAYFDGVLSPDGDRVFRMGEVNLNYLVSPASAAREIASAFYLYPENFSIITNQALAPFAIKNDIVNFNITSIRADEDGMLYLSAQPDIIDLEAFLDGDFTYQASFRLATDKGDERTTQFVDILKRDIEVMNLEDMIFTSDMYFFTTESSEDPNDPLWFGQASKMINVDIDPLTGILSPWEGLKDLSIIVNNSLFEDFYRLDPAKLKFTRRIAGQYIYSGQTNHQIFPKTVSFSNGVLSSDAQYADKDYTNEKCMVEITVHYDGVLLSSGNYACLRFMN